MVVVPTVPTASTAAAQLVGGGEHRVWQVTHRDQPRTARRRSEWLTRGSMEHSDDARLPAEARARSLIAAQYARPVCPNPRRSSALACPPPLRSRRGECHSQQGPAGRGVTNNTRLIVSIGPCRTRRTLSAFGRCARYPGATRCATPPLRRRWPGSVPGQQLSAVPRRRPPLRC